MTRTWQYYSPPGGGEPVAKEIKKAGLTLGELGQLDEVMARVAEGRTLPKDTKPIRDGVHQFKLNLRQRSYRLLYAEVDDGLVLLALHFFSKKKQKDQDAVDLAVDRLRTWRASQ
ncbi:type II toxin-antitoxin system RelE/ParE family toxin [Actinophytocola sediminis]